MVLNGFTSIEICVNGVLDNILFPMHNGNVTKGGLSLMTEGIFFDELCGRKVHMMICQWIQMCYHKPIQRELNVQSNRLNNCIMKLRIP